MPILKSASTALALCLLAATAHAQLQSLQAATDTHVKGIATLNTTAGPTLDNGQAPTSVRAVGTDPSRAIPITPKYSFASTPVGTTNANNVTFTSTFTAATTVYGSGVFTQGAINSDFKDVGTGTCDTNGYPYSYAANASCTTVVSFTPSKAGNRLGAELLYVSADETSYYIGQLNGIGSGPQVTVAPTTPAPASILTGLTPYNSAIDGNGTLYVSDSAAATVKQFVLSGGVYPATPTNTFTGFASPQGLAVDGSGSLYVGDSTKGYVWKLSAINGTVPAGAAPLAFVTFLAPSTTQPVAVAVDPTQSYLWFTGTYSAKDYLIDCIITSGSCALGATFTASKGMTIDSAGYRYVVDSSTKIVYRLAVGTGTTKTTLITGLTLPYGIAFDPAGDLYVSDAGTGTGTGTVTEFIAATGTGLVPASTPTSTNTRSIATGLNNPYGVTLNSLGNVFISDNGNTAVKEIDNTDPFTLTFPSTTYGASVNQSATLQNIGNAALTFNSANPALSNPAYTIDPSTTCTTTLAAGAICAEVTNFTPTSGGNTLATEIFTDTSLNATAATQTINLTGLSPAQATQTVVTLSSPTATVGGSTIYYTATVTDTVNANLTPTGTITFTDTYGSNNATYGPYALNASGSFQSPFTEEVAGTHTITAAYTSSATAQYSNSTSSGQTLTVAQAQESTLAPPTIYVQQGSSVTLVAFFTFPGTNPPTGTVSFSFSGTATVGTPSCIYKSGHSNCQALLTIPANLNPGQYVFTYSQASDANYLSTSGSATVTVTASSSSSARKPTTVALKPITNPIR